MSKRTCSIEECERIVYGRGMCNLHWHRWRRTGNPQVKSTRWSGTAHEGRMCSIDGCQRKHYGRGWCYLHWSRWNKYGDPLADFSRWAGMSGEDRFWAKVDRRGPDECWPWLAASEHSGYGCFWIDGRLHRAGRVAWMFTNGPIPADLWVLHRCDNPPCVNPGHLFLGTRQDNIADMVTKGRWWSGRRADAYKRTDLPTPLQRGGVVPAE